MHSEANGVPYGHPMHPVIVADSVADVLEASVLATFHYLLVTHQAVEVTRPNGRVFFVTPMLGNRWAYAMSSNARQHILGGLTNG